VGKLAETRVVATIHSDKQYSVAERFVLARSDLVLACGKQVMQNIQRFIPSEKVKVLNNAIHGPDNRGAHTGDLLREIGIKKGSRLVVSLGRLTRLKGYDLLIKAFKKVLVDMPDTVLLIGGDGEEKDRLIKLVESYGLKENIRLLGMVSEIHELLEACDLYVNSSRWEGLPMTLLEAMAHGKPMVATSVGGNPEVVLDGVTGILVQPDDPQGLANAIIRMMKDDAFRRKAGKAALSLFTQKYTIEKHCQTLAKYYLQVLKNNISASKVPETIINHNNS